MSSTRAIEITLFFEIAFYSSRHLKHYQHDVAAKKYDNEKKCVRDHKKSKIFRKFLRLHKFTFR